MSTIVDYVEVQGNLVNTDISFLQSQISSYIAPNLQLQSSSVKTTITFQQPIVTLPNGQQLAVMFVSIQAPDNAGSQLTKVGFSNANNNNVNLWYTIASSGMSINLPNTLTGLNFTIVQDFGSVPTNLYQITVLSSGQPVQGATVTANLIGSNSTNSTNISVRVFTTDSTGSVYIATASTSFSVSISAAGYVTQTQNITQPHTQITIAPTPLNTNNMLPIIGVAVGGLLLLMMAGGGGGED